MKAKFVCDYLHYSGIFCGRVSTQPEGCRSHHKAKKGQFYSEPGCINVTRIPCGRCLHIKGYYMIQHINRLQNKALMYNQYTSEVRLRGEI